MYDGDASVINRDPKSPDADSGPIGDTEVSIEDDIGNQEDEEPRVLWLVVTGSRIKQKYIVNARKYVQHVFASIIQEAAGIYDQIIVVQGTCRDSADVWCRALAITMGVDYRDYPANWGLHGPRVAGFIRNEQMMAEVSGFSGDKKVVAFWDKTSAGTEHAIQMADKYGLGIPRLVDMSAYREED